MGLFFLCIREVSIEICITVIEPIPIPPVSLKRSTNEPIPIPPARQPIRNRSTNLYLYRLYLYRPST